MEKLKLIKFEEFYSTSLECAIIFQEKNHYVIKHTHDFIEIACQLTGSSVHGYNNQKITLNQYDCLIMNTEQIHENFKTDTNIINILISPKLLANIIQESSFDPYIIDLKHKFMNQTHIETYKLNNQCIDIINKLIDNKAKHKDGYYFKQRLLIIELLLTMNESINFNTIGNKQEECDVVTFIHQNLSTATLNGFASKTNQAPSTLSNKIKSQYNRTFLEILHDSRLSKAIELLTETSMSIDNIIITIGYENKTYFYKLFKNKYGVTPREYRKNLRR